MKHRIAQRLSIMTCLICSVIAPMVSLADDEMTIHGTSIRNSEDPKNPTATSETLSIDEVEPTLGAVLENATGVGIRRSGNLGRSEFIQLRGTLGHQAQIRLEGIPLLFLQGQSINLSALPLGLFDTVRVTRGGSSVDYGSGAQGGVVHLTQDPRISRSPSASLRIGSFGYTRLNGLVPITRNGDQMSIGVQLEQSSGHFEFEDLNGRSRVRENNDHKSANLFSLGRWKIRELGTLKLLLDSYTDERGEPGPMEFPNQSARSETRRLISGLNLKLVPLIRGRLITDLVLFTQLRSMKFSDPTPSFVGDPTRFRMTDQSIAGAITSQFQLSPDITLGGNLETQLSQIKTRDTARTRHQRSLSSLGMNAEWQPNRAVQFTAGSRLQQGVKSPHLMPRVGSSLVLTRGIKFNANLSKFFRLPSLDELYYKGVGIAGNPNLDPEQGQSADIGLVWQPVTTFLDTLSLHGFITQFDSLIYFAPIDAYRYQTQNHPGGVIMGTEFMLSASIADFGLRASHRYQESASQNNKGTPLPYRPTHLTRVYLTHSMDRFMIKLTANQVSDQTIDMYGRRQLSGYRELDARLDYTPSQTWLISLTASNLLDENNHRDFPTLPRPGRTLLLLLSLTAI